MVRSGSRYQIVWFFRQAAMVVCLWLLMPSSAGAASAEPCDFKTATGYKTLLDDALSVPKNPITARFQRPVLAGDGRARIVINKPFSEWPATKVCGLLLWKKLPAGEDQSIPCDPDAPPSRCIPLTAIGASGDPNDTTRTYLTFDVPTWSQAQGGEEGWSPLRTPAQIRVVGYAQEKSGNGDQTVWVPVFTFAGTTAISGFQWSLLWALVFGAAAYLLAVLLARRSARLKGSATWKVLNPVVLTSGVYGKASLSRLQIYVFTLIVGILVIFTWSRSGVLLPLTDDLLMLLGISAAGSGAAKFTAVQKKQPKAEPRLYLERKGWTKSDPARAHWSDLVLTDGKLDVYKFQMATFTGIVAAVVLSSGLSDQGVVEIPETYLALLGLSQAVYVGGKAISQSNVSEFETAILDMKKAEEAYWATGKAPDVAKDDTWTTYKAKVSGDALTTFDAYEKAARAARDVFQMLYDIEISDDQLLPKR
jgi:hypothetical protein